MKQTKRYLQYLAAEREASRMYRALAEVATGDPQEALLELADIEDKHAAHWESLLRENGVEVPPDSGELEPSSADLVKRARQLSLAAVLPELEAAERDAQSVYNDEPDALPGMAHDEQLHAQVLAGLLNKTGASSADAAESSGSRTAKPGKNDPSNQALVAAGRPGRSTAEVREAFNNAEGWHRTDKSGSLRAAVFGVSDGLVSNTALVMGFAGSAAAGGTVLFAGLAGLLAGAFSMAAGEYVSMASQRELFQREISLEAQELRDKPLEEQRELELLYRAKGFSKGDAKNISAKIMSDPDTALDTLVREELGLDPDELGSPWKTALSSFAAFTLGAAVPVIPYVFLGQQGALIMAIVLALIALLAVGGTVGYLSGAGIFKSSLRQLIVGAAAGGVTFVVGSIVGVSLG